MVSLFEWAGIREQPEKISWAFGWSVHDGECGPFSTYRAWSHQRAPWIKAGTPPGWYR